MKIAKLRCKKVKEYANDLWKVLLTGKVDPANVQNLISKMYWNQKAAHELYEKTLQKYNENIVVAYHYAIFLEVSVQGRGGGVGVR